jgi:hypothetical protein
VLEITATESGGIAIVEPFVTFEQLATCTLKLGFIPEVVPELKTITSIRSFITDSEPSF